MSYGKEIQVNPLTGKDLLNDPRIIKGEVTLPGGMKLVENTIVPEGEVWIVDKDKIQKEIFQSFAIPKECMESEIPQVPQIPRVSWGFETLRRYRATEESGREGQVGMGDQFYEKWQKGLCLRCWFQNNKTFCICKKCGEVMETREVDPLTGKETKDRRPTWAFPHFV